MEIHTLKQDYSITDKQKKQGFPRKNFLPPFRRSENADKQFFDKNQGKTVFFSSIAVQSVLYYIMAEHG